MEDTLDIIPQDQTDEFSEGISEVTQNSKECMEAFLEGLSFSDDIDVHHGKPFERGGLWVVRVYVGNWR